MASSGLIGDNGFEGESLLRLEHLDRDGQVNNDRTTSRGVIFVFVIIPALIGLGIFASYMVSSKRRDDLTKESLLNTIVPTILISIDGFRYDYINRTKSERGVEVPLAPTLTKLAANGVRAEPGMEPVMPSETFPNHWSLVTGLYPESHGIIGNTMYSPITKTWFHHAGTDPHWWSGEPIWQTLRQTPRMEIGPDGTPRMSKENYTTGCVFWVGCEVEKHAPDVFWVYNQSVSYEDRVNRAIQLLSGTADDFPRKVNFVTLYFEGVDSAGHAHGPDSIQVNSEIERVDSAIALLSSGLKSTFGDRVNVVVVSDHGMSAVSNDRTVDLAGIIPEGTVQDVRTTPFGVWLNVSEPATLLYQELYDEFKNQDGHAAVYTKENMPERWHLSHSTYITHVVTLAKLGWTVKYPHQKLVLGARLTAANVDLSLTTDRENFDRVSSHREYGNHGFDNTEKEMQATLIASGPAFRTGSTVKGFRNVDLYPLLCHIFSATPAPNNGSLDISTSSILRVSDQ